MALAKKFNEPVFVHSPSGLLLHRLAPESLFGCRVRGFRAVNSMQVG